MTHKESEEFGKHNDDVEIVVGKTGVRPCEREKRDKHQQKCKNLLQDRVSSDTGALLRGRAIDARCIGLHRPRENSLEWGARIARHRDRRGCTAMYPNAGAPALGWASRIGTRWDTV